MTEELNIRVCSVYHAERKEFSLRYFFVEYSSVPKERVGQNKRDGGKY